MSDANDLKHANSATGTDREIELEKIRSDARLQIERMKTDVRKVVFGTMIVGVAVAFFPFAQEFSKAWFAKSVEEIRKESEFAILEEKNRLAKELETQKYELEERRQSAADVSARRDYLERLADEARSERIERQIIIAEFFSFLGEDNTRSQWEGFRDYLIAKQKRLNTERELLLATVNELESSPSERASAAERLRQIERLQNPEENSQSSNLPMPPGSAGQSKLGRSMLQIAISEANRGVNEHTNPHRVGAYWASLGLPYDGSDRDKPWSAAFVSWVIDQTGNPHDLRLGPSHMSMWRSAVEKGLTVGPNEASPVPGDIAVRMRNVGHSEAWNSQAEWAPGFSGFVYEVSDDNLVVIGGNANDSVRSTIWRRDDPRLVGYIRLGDLPSNGTEDAPVTADEPAVPEPAE